MYKPIIGRTIFYIEIDNMIDFMAMTKRQGIDISEVKQINSGLWQFTIHVKQLKQTKTFLESKELDYQVIRHEGLLLKTLIFLTKKEVILPIIFSCFILYILSNIVWKVDIEKVEPMIQPVVKEELEKLGLYTGAWQPNIPRNETIKLTILDHLDTLQYFNIYYEGTTYYIEAEMKDMQQEKEAKGPQHLIANKNGVIEQFAVKQGEIKKSVHDVVKKGDILVSGIIEQPNMVDDKNKKSKDQFIRAEGEVYANTWYEMTVTSPLASNIEKITGEYFHRYYIQISKYSVPIWGKINPPFQAQTKHKETQDIKLLQWTLPFKVIKETNYEKEQIQDIQTEQASREKILQYIRSHLHTKLGKNVEIKKYYVLHETVHNGKVNMNLYISVRENIAEAKPIQK